MIDIILDTLIDTAKLLPFLFLTFLLMEYIEHKTNKKNDQLMKKSGKFGPLWGGILGGFPQCGFSVAATNLYATRIITVGTLIAVYLSTSDEMLPIMISSGVSIVFILKILALKIGIGIICGFVIDLIIRNKKKNCVQNINSFCNEKHCDCEHGIVKSAIKHTVSIALFIMIISLVLNIGITYLGIDRLSTIFMKNSIFGPFLASLIGLIPNCAASVLLTELYLNSAISFGSLIAGLLTGSGVALLVLFRLNKNIKENLRIVGTIYAIGVIFGIIIDLIISII